MYALPKKAVILLMQFSATLRSNSKKNAAHSIAHTVLITHIEQKALHKGTCFDSRPVHVNKCFLLWCPADLNWVGVRFADGAFKLLEHPLPPLIDWIILLEELSRANGPKPLQHMCTQQLNALSRRSFYYLQ